MDLSIRYDLRRAEQAPPQHEIYQTFLEQCAYADKNGFEVVRLQEHHGMPDGYLPAPNIMAAAAAARTTNIKIRLSVLVLTLHNPLRVAEDLAVLDQLAQGRLQVTVAAGYVPNEFALFGVDLDDRVRLLEEKIAVLRQAWTGEPFAYNGGVAQVTPRPFENRQIPIILGGSSNLAARLAARVADGFEPIHSRFKPPYVEACEKAGKAPGWMPGNAHHLSMLHVSEDPDRAWARIGPFAMHEANGYAKLAPPTHQFKAVESADELRVPGMYTIVTPDECFDILSGLGADAEATFSPLVAGMDPDLGWESLELIVGKVVPRLREAGLH